MKLFFKKYWSIILLAIILLSVSILSFRNGQYLLSNDNYSPELDPRLSIIRSLVSPAWRSYRVLGFASDSEQADIFRSVFYWVLNLFTNTAALSQIYSLICLWVGTFSMAFLTRFFVRDFIKTQNSSVIFLISGIIYLTTLWTAWVFNFNMMPYITQFGFLPLLLLSLYVLYKDWSNLKLLFVFVSSILFTATSVISTLFFVDIVVIFFFVLLIGYLHRISWRKILYSILIFLGTQLFWILPFISYTATTSSDVIDSYTNRSITSNTIDLEKQMMTLSNSAKLYTRLLVTDDDPSTGTYIFPLSEDYLQHDLYKVIAFIPLFFSLVGLIFAIFKKKYKLIPLWIFLFGFLFLLANQNLPLGGIYTWIQEHFNIFKEVFRWISSKASQPYLIFLTITGGIGFIYLTDFLSSFLKGKWKYIPIYFFSIICSGAFFFFGSYLFSNNLFAQRATVSFPNEYYQLQEYLKDDTESRIYYAPPSNNGYFREYQWGFVGSQFLGYILPNPLMDMSLSIGSKYAEDAMLQLNNTFESGDFNAFNTELSKYDVKYILVDRSLVQGRYGYVLNWDVLNSYTTNWNLVWSDDFLELYQLEQTYIESTNENPEIGALDSNLSISEIYPEYFAKTFEYKGTSGFYTLNVENIDQESLPTTIRFENNTITTSPTIPVIAGVSLTSTKTFAYQPFEYLLSSGNVFTKSEIQEGVTIENSWGNVNSIQLLRESAFDEIDLTKTLKSSEPGDCSGDKYLKTTEIVPEEIASGFLISGNSGLPCVSTLIDTDSQSTYVAKLHLNWESDSDNLAGICLFSNNQQRCLNNQKFFGTTDGYGEEDILVQNTFSGDDQLSISVYAFNPTGKQSTITVRNASVSLASEFSDIEVTSTTKNTNNLTVSLMNGDIVTIKIPYIHGVSSYKYDGDIDSYIWLPTVASDNSEEYSVSFDSGMVQNVFGQYMNQYQNLLETVSNNQYLWIYEGENISNIPATICLTYQGDDKCWIDDTFYDSGSHIISRIFKTSGKYTKLDASYNSTSFASESINNLKNLTVMKIPTQWMDIEIKPVTTEEYKVVEATGINISSTPLIYKYSTQSDGNIILSIPQSESKNWLAVSLSKQGGTLLSHPVTIDGWKQGWDISNIEFDNIYIIYWPNLLAYIGYIIILSEFVYILVKIFKKRKYAKQ